MNALFLTAVLILGAQEGDTVIETTQQPLTQLYVATVPSGAEVLLDGKSLGQSDQLFNVSPGSHKLSIVMEDFLLEERTIEVAEHQITRIEVKLKTRIDQQTVLTYVGDKNDKYLSYADTGFAVEFDRPANMKSLVAVKIFAARYGMPKAPKEDFHIYLLDQDKNVLEEVLIPYDKVERISKDEQLHWYTLNIPAINVPEHFYVAFWFNAESTKGIYMGMKKNGAKKHPFVGLPDKGYEELDEPYEWMIRAVVSSEEGKKPSCPKVSTYEEEKPADTESVEALPLRTWNDTTGAFSVEAQYVDTNADQVKLKKADGKVVAVPLALLCDADQEFVRQQIQAKLKATKADGKAEELSHDDGKMKAFQSIAGGGHAVKFHVDGDSNYVTSVSLHGSRYGEARPPKEDFKVWICDAQFKPIASFEFPYSSYLRGKPVWKNFRIRPTQVPEDFIVCFGFNPHQTKGIYVSYDDQPSTTSMIGIPNNGDHEPFEKGNWMIRCKVENRGNGSGDKDK